MMSLGVPHTQHRRKNGLPQPQDVAALSFFFRHQQSRLLLKLPYSSFLQTLSILCYSKNEFIKGKKLTVFVA